MLYEVITRVFPLRTLEQQSRCRVVAERGACGERGGGAQRETERPACHAGTSLARRFGTGARNNFV